MAAHILMDAGIDNVDIVLGKYTDDIGTMTRNDAIRIKHWWELRGIAVLSMQSLFFGTVGMNLFDDRGSRERMLSHIALLCRAAEWIGAKYLTFGSPKNKYRESHCSETLAETIAVEFFWQASSIAAAHGVTICLEPTPTCYGANFMTSSEETVAVIDAVNHPAVRMQLDVGACTLNNESVVSVIRKYGNYIGHIHASEPFLLPMGSGTSDHVWAARAINDMLPDHIVSMEVIRPGGKFCAAAVKQSVERVTWCYRDMFLL